MDLSIKKISSIQLLIIKKFIELSKVDKAGNIVSYGNKDDYEEYKYGVGGTKDAPTKVGLGHKDIELINDASEFNITCDHINGYMPCTDLSSEPGLELYCCQEQTIPLLEKCPKGSTYHANKCWVETNFDYVCTGEGFHPENGKCIRHEVENPVDACPQIEGIEFQIECTMDSCVCVAEINEDVPVCVEPAYWLNGKCVQDEETDFCPPHYDTKDGKYCIYEYHGECNIKLPNLRGLAEKRSGWSTDIAETIRRGVQSREKEEEEPSQYEYTKAMLEGSRAITKAQQTAANVRQKTADIRANIERQKNLKLALEAYISTKEVDGKDKNVVKKKTPQEKVYYESNKHVTSQCKYQDIVPVSKIKVTNEIDPQPLGDSKPLVIDAEKVCLSPGFIYDIKFDQCVIYDEKKLQKKCPGVVSADVCLANVAKDATCPEPWNMTTQDDGVPACERLDVVPGKYTWVGNFDCIGDPKYCEALFKYKGH